MRILLHLLVAVVVSSQLFSQVHIREKVVVGDKARSVTSLQDAGGCDGVYLRQGGGVVIDPQWFAAHVSRYNWEMWLGSTPVLVGDRDSLPKFIGSYKQWSQLVLTMHYTQPPESAYVPYCLDPLSTLSVGPEYPAFLFYRVLETTPLYRWDIAMKMELTPDSTLEAIPPQQVFDEFLLPWNPYVRDPDAVMDLPYPGTYRVVIMRSNANGRDDLVLRSPVDTTLLTEAQAHVQDTLVIGPYPAWTQLEMALVSRSSKVLEGQTLYPLVTQISPSTWELSFEDWTDLDFDDLDIRVELNVGTPQSLALRTATGVIWYGDTVNVALLPVDSLGRLSPLGRDWAFEYSIEMPDSIRRYGTLILDGDPGYEFEHIVPDAGIGRGLQFAANGDEPDSVVALSFHLKATYVGEIIAAKVSPGGGSDPPGFSGSVQQRAKRQAVQTAGLQPHQTVEDDPPEIGEVVLENDTGLDLDRDVILLGETKYYAAVKELDPTDPEMNTKLLRLYAVTNFDKTGKPLFAGQEADVRFETGRQGGAATSTLYHEKKWPLWQPDTLIMKDLEEGLIRVVGRYWSQGSEENKVILWVESTTEPKLLEKRLIEVKKPARLGNSNSTVTDVDGDPNFDLDDLIIKFAGEYGIPPQVLKGQVEKESNFRPGYRWEPFFEVASNVHKSQDLLDNQYRIRSAVDKGSPGIPSRDEHSNVYRATDRPLTDPGSNYWGFVGTVWEFLYDNCKIVNPEASTDLYKYKSGIWYDRALKGYQNVWETASIFYELAGPDEEPDRPWEEFEVVELSRLEANFWLSNYYQDGRMSTAIAQTRIASSYGFLQLLYTTGTGKQGYPVDDSHRPEDLQVPRTVFSYAAPYLSRQLDEQLAEDNADNEQDWKRGFEETIRIALNMYNGRKNQMKEPTRYTWPYGMLVWGFSKNYPSQVR